MTTSTIVYARRLALAMALIFATGAVAGGSSDPPEAVCKEIATLYLEDGTGTVVPDDIDDGSTDDVGIVDRTVLNGTFDAMDYFASPILQVQDGDGQFDYCATFVSIIDPSFSYDFCTQLALAVSDVNLPGLDPRLDALLAAFSDFATADVNGSFVLTRSFGDVDLVVEANGIPDVSNELALLQTILQTPGFDNGVLDHATVVAAYAANREQILRSVLLRGVDVVPAFLDVATAYLTIGGGDFAEEVIAGGTRATATGNFGIMALLGHEFNREASFFYPPLDPLDFISFPELRLYGDADGDGAPNICEFDAGVPATACPFVVGAGTSYVTDALNPAVTPADCPDFGGEGEGETEGEIGVDCEDLTILDADFEAAGAWTSTGGGEVSSAYGNARTGAGAGYLLFNTSTGPDSLSQSIVLPDRDLATLRFWRQTLRTDLDFEVRIDGNVIFSESDVIWPSYQPAAIDVSAYADGASHTLSFHGTDGGAKATYVIDGINIDDVSIEVCDAPEVPCIACVPSGATTFEVGDTICLRVPDPVAPGSSFTWYKDGNPLVGAPGQNLDCQSIELSDAQTADSGTYTCAYDDGSKAAAVYSVTIQVLPELPVSNGYILLLLMVVLPLGLAALMALRKRAA